jgi:predicted enzyme related to lactoylglutathione lyase
VVGFAVDDIDAARAELDAAGIEVLGPVQRGGGLAWLHFRGADGNVWELTQRET